MDQVDPKELFIIIESQYQVSNKYRGIRVYVSSLSLHPLTLHSLSLHSSVQYYFVIERQSTSGACNPSSISVSVL